MGSGRFVHAQRLSQCLQNFVLDIGGGFRLGGGRHFNGRLGRIGGPAVEIPQCGGKTGRYAGGSRCDALGAEMARCAARVNSSRASVVEWVSLFFVGSTVRTGDA